MDVTTNPTATWNVQNEWKTVVLMSLGFGLVGIDRFMLLPMFPVIAKELGLDYQDMGIIAGALAVTWGLTAIFIGNIADRFGRRKVLIYALIVFSVLVGLSGLAAGAGSLIVLRAVMGFAEGAYAPAAITATLEASQPSRHGMNLGFQQAALPLLGLGLAPIVVTQLLHVIDWRWIFLLVALPGFLLAYLVFKVLRDHDPKELALHKAYPLSSTKRLFPVRSRGGRCPDRSLDR